MQADIAIANANAVSLPIAHCNWRWLVGGLESLEALASCFGFVGLNLGLGSGLVWFGLVYVSCWLQATKPLLCSPFIVRGLKYELTVDLVCELHSV